MVTDVLIFARNLAFSSAKFLRICQHFEVVAFLCTNFIRFNKEHAQALVNCSGKPKSARSRQLDLSSIPLAAAIAILVEIAPCESLIFIR